MLGKMKTTTARCSNCAAVVEYSDRKCPYCGADVLFIDKQKDVFGGTSDDETFVIEVFGDDKSKVISVIEFTPTGDIHVGREDHAYTIATEQSYAMVGLDFTNEPPRFKTEDHFERNIFLLVTFGTIAYVIFISLLGVLF